MSETQGGRSRIVVVEDNPADVELLRMTLHRAGVECDLTILEDGGVALDWIRAFDTSVQAAAPDLAILDLNLPESDGLEVLSAIGQHPALKDVPVVVLTSSSSPRERAKLEGLPIARHLIKPMSFDEFMRIGTVLNDVLLENRPPGV
jgi:CheY-like chemotaxis protein